MARCPDCNKFVSDEVNEDVEPDFTIDEVRDEEKLSDDPAEPREVVVVVSMTANVERNCAECGTTLKQLEYSGVTEVTLYLPDPPRGEDEGEPLETGEDGEVLTRGEVDRRWNEHGFELDFDGGEVEETGSRSKLTIMLVANGTIKATGAEVGGSAVEETFTITDEHQKGEFEDY